MSAGGFTPVVGGPTVGVTGNVYVSNTLQTNNVVVSGNVNTSGTGVYQVAGTTVIDASRNLTNIGTVGSGAITSSSSVSGTTLTASTAHDTSGSGVYKVASTTVIDASRNLTNIGTVGSGAITSSSTVSGTTLTASTAHDTSGSGVYKVASTTVIDASRNLTNIGSVSASSMSLSTALSITNGGTGQTTAQAAINSLVGGTTNRAFLRGDGTNVSMSAIQAADVPTLNQSTTGSAGSLSTTFTGNYILYGQGTGVPAFSSNLTFTSNILTCSNDVVAYSDRNIKTDIEPILDALSKVSRIGGYTFTRTDIKTGRRTGVIAQEVREVLPEAVYETENGTLTVAYGNMVGLLIEAIKDLKTSLDTAHIRITELENKFQT
jgi:hypothetical protein